MGHKSQDKDLTGSEGREEQRLAEKQTRENQRSNRNQAAGELARGTDGGHLQEKHTP